MEHRQVATIILHDTDRGKLGPCMTALTARQKKFVWAMLDTGGSNHKACALAAGYIGNDNTLAVTAHRLAHDENVQAAIQEEARKRMGAAQIMAASHLVLIAGNPAHKDQLSAIKEIMNRSGLHAVTEQKISVTHALDRAGMIKQIAELAAQQGLDPKKLLGSYSIPIDTEFNEVSDEEEIDDLGDIL